MSLELAPCVSLLKALAFHKQIGPQTACHVRLLCPRLWAEPLLTGPRVADLSGLQTPLALQHFDHREFNVSFYLLPVTALPDGNLPSCGLLGPTALPSPVLYAATTASSSVRPLTLMAGSIRLSERLLLKPARSSLAR